MDPKAAAAFAAAPRAVKPRTPKNRHYPVIAISDNDVLYETGEMSSTFALLATLSKRVPTLFVATGAADFLAHLDSVYSDNPRWQWRTSQHERTIANYQGEKVATRVTTAVHYFGWKGGNYHRIIDPVTMYGHKLDDIWPIRDDKIVKLLKWGMTIRDFCEINGLDVRPTTGGISAQLLTDKRFYPNPRRKVPAATNARTREEMPGNYYRLLVRPDPEREYRAHYLDQRRAHHFHARTAELPDADTLYAYGRFADLDHVIWPDANPNFYGLYCLDLRHKPGVPRSFHWLGEAPYEGVFVYSNEIPLLLNMGFRITGIRAAWGSHKRDQGIARLAIWSEEQLDTYGDPPWLKPLLLSAYGVLATRPKIAEALFKQAKAGTPMTVPTGRHKLTGIHTQGLRKLEPRIANVLHRGMIEAATRAESVTLARELSRKGHRILSIYADAVIVQDDCDNPLINLPEPWRLKKTLNHLQFINQQAFVSGEMTKLPGVGKELSKYRSGYHGTRPARPIYEAGTGQRIQ